MKLKKVILGVVVMLGLVSLGACGKKETTDNWKEIEKNKTVTVGLDDTFVPMGFKDEAGNIVGFDVDLAKAVFKQYGIKVKFQPIDWSMKESELENGTIDMIWNGYTVTEERKEKVAFSQSYASNEQVIVTTKKSAITSVAGLKNKKVGAQEGSSGYDDFINEPKKLKNIVADNDAVQYASFNEAFIDLKSGRISGLLIDKVYAEYYLKQMGTAADYTILPSGFSNENFAVGVRKNNKELVKKINAGLQKVEKNGEYAQISKKWFDEELTIPEN